MKLRFCDLILGLFTLIAFTQPALAQQPTAQSLPSEDSSYIDEEARHCLSRHLCVCTSMMNAPGLPMNRLSIAMPRWCLSWPRCMRNRATDE